MEYLQHAEMKALLKASLAYGNREAHLALVTMYGTGSRVSQVLALKGIDVIPDTETGGHRIRIGAAKRGQTRTYRVLVSPDPALDMRDLVELAKTRGTNALFGALDRHYLHRLIKRFAAEAGLHPTLHCQVIPGGHPHLIRINLRRHVGVRAKEAHYGGLPFAQKTPVRIGFRYVAKQSQPSRGAALLRLQVQGQVSQKRRSLIVIGNQRREGIAAHQLDGIGQIRTAKLWRQVHVRAVLLFKVNESGLA